MNSTISKELLKSFYINKHKTLFQIRRGFKRYRWTYGDALSMIIKTQIYLDKLGYKEGDMFVIWAQNMPEWAFFFITSLFSGFVPVPADPQASTDTLLRYINKTNPKFILTSKFLYPLLRDVNITVPVLIIEDIFNELNSMESRNVDPYISEQQLFEIVFTSGSSGDPKGVLISRENILAQLEQCSVLIPRLPKYETVSILPLSHLYEQIYGLILPIYYGGTINYLERINPLFIKRELQRCGATYLMAVPQMLRIFYEEILDTAEKDGKLQVFKFLDSLSIPMPFFIRRLLFNKIHASFGGNVKFIASGSAPLEPKLARAWENMGFSILEGYGASETTGMVTVLPFKGKKFGTVGKPAKNVQIQLSSENEILVKGPVLSSGYFNDLEKTKTSFENGWYRTGDTGKLDSAGNLIITGRISTRIIMQDGTKVYPEDIERVINNEEQIKDSCVIETSVAGEPKIHAVLLLRSKETDKNELINKINKKLESKQQIFLATVWNDADFPRLRSLKVDRIKIRELVNSGLGDIPLNKTVDLGVLQGLLKSLAVTGNDSINDNATLGNDLGIDSLRRLELFALIEQSLGLSIDESLVTSNTTIGELKVLLQNQKQVVQKYDPDKILSSFRFSIRCKVLREMLHKFLIYPIHSLFIKIQIEEKDAALSNIKNNKEPYLFVFNHIGILDLICIYRIIGIKKRWKLATIVTNERWEDGNHLVSGLIELVFSGYPVAKQGAGLKTGIDITAELYDKNYSILMAPEGEMERTGVERKFLPGLGFLVRELGVPVIMFKISDSYKKAWTNPKPGESATAFKNILPKGFANVRVKIGKATIDNTRSYEEITADIQKQFDLL